MSSRPNHDAFVVTAPGLEPFVAGELKALGLSDARVTDGGATFTATTRSLYAANLHLRTASRVVVRAGQFVATAFHELERRAGRVPWEAFISPNLGVSLRVTCRKSRLYHSDAVAERIAGAILSRFKGTKSPTFDDAAVSDETDDGDDLTQLVLVRLFHDRCTISIDSSGPLLHLRGYRQVIAKAPMRETLAAATLMAGGWRGDAPLIDPMCGSGTIPIEGALIARRIAPGLRRRFAFQHWPDFDETTWRSVFAEAEDAVLSVSPAPIQGSDRDSGAIEAARANAMRAGVDASIEFSERPVSAITPKADSGWVVSNPPYGIRVGERDRLRNLYAQFGNVMRAKCPGWHVALLSADTTLQRQLRLPLEPVLKTTNGGIKVSVVAGQVPASMGEKGRNRRTAPDTTAAQRYPS